MKREKFDPLCHKLLTRYVKVSMKNGKTLTGYLRPLNDEPVQADLGKFQVGETRIFASKVKALTCLYLDLGKLR